MAAKPRKEETMKENYTIYKFTFSDGKIYIGQTSQPVEERWKNGEGYKGQDVYVPIILEGWNNIQKEILHTGLTEEQANKLEKFYIKKFNSVEKGYNRNYGISHSKGNTNLGKTSLRLISDNITEQQKIECINYILQNLNGQQGNLLKVIWFFIINDNKNLILKKELIIKSLNIQPDKYYDVRQKLIDLKWLEIDVDNSTLNICYNNILKEIQKAATVKQRSAAI